MGKVVYLDQRHDQSTASQPNVSRRQAGDVHTSRDLVAENLTLLAEERQRLSSSHVGANRPPSYKTTRVYEFQTVIADFALSDSAIVRLAKNASPDSLPVIAVVHGSQMNDDKRSALLIGQTIFVNHGEFENWVAGKAEPSFEDRMLLLLTQYLSIGNTSPI